MCDAETPRICCFLSMLLFLLQRSGSRHHGQSALHPSSSLHCVSDGVDHHFLCHLCCWLRWVWILPVLALTAEGVFFLYSPWLWCMSSFPQASGFVTGSTTLWAEGRRPTSSSLKAASTQISAFTFSAAKHGSSSVGFHSAFFIRSSTGAVIISSWCFFFFQMLCS